MKKHPAPPSGSLANAKPRYGAFARYTIAASFAIFAAASAHAAQTWHVAAATGSDANDGLTAETAFKTIQKAIDSAEWGDHVLVDDGTYGAISTTNMLLSIESVNGAEKTVIDGRGQARAADLGYGESMWAIVTNTVLHGFTIRNGYASYGGGGAVCGTLEKCLITGNRASVGGGSWGGRRIECIFVGNNADSGGGMAGGTLERCVLSNNTARVGGGVYCAKVSNSILCDNSASSRGGGAWADTTRADGSYACSLDHCTLYGNVATETGGGMYEGVAVNCLFWENTANEGFDAYRSDVSYSCVTNLFENQGDGKGNIEADPCFVSPETGDFHLQDISPCVNAGRKEKHPNLQEKDVEGNVRIRDGRTDMGAYEADVADIAGLVVVSSVGGGVTPDISTIGSGEDVTVRAFGPRPFIGFYTNGVLVSTERTHTFTNVMEDIFLSAEFGLTDSPMIIYADAIERLTVTDGDSPQNAMPLQTAIDVAVAGDTVVVANGVYGPISTENKGITIQSEHGAETTIIDGGGTNRCATLGIELNDRETRLVGFTLRNGYTSMYGGGALYGSLENCVLTSNRAYGGGGAERANLKNCIVTTNTASYGGGIEFADCEGCSLIGNVATLAGGGGARAGTLVDCLIDGNQCAADGGGTESCDALRCIYRNNSAKNGGGANGGFLENCLLVGNAASSRGGGCYGAYLPYGESVTLVNCTVVGNTAGDTGAGIYSMTVRNSHSFSQDTIMCVCVSVNNSIIWENRLLSGMESNFDSNSGNGRGVRFQYSCTSPLPQGDGNISDYPSFNDDVSGDYQLADNSPCINAGVETFTGMDTWEDRDPRTGQREYVCYLWTETITSETDIAGNPRNAFGGMDMGAYEFQGISTRRIEELEFEDVWGAWSPESAQGLSFPSSVDTLDELAQSLWTARDAFVRAGAATEVVPSADKVVLSVGAVSVPDSLLDELRDVVAPTEENGVSVCHVHLREDSDSRQLVVVGNGDEMPIASFPDYLAYEWVRSVYGNPPNWFSNTEKVDWFAARARDRIEWLVTLVPESAWADFAAARSQKIDEAEEAEEGETVFAMDGIVPAAQSNAAHRVSILSSSTGTVRIFGTDDLSVPGWKYRGLALQSRGPATAGAVSDSEAQFFFATRGDVDADADGIPDVVETYVLGTDPHNAHTGGDTLTDWEKIYRYDLNPFVRDTAGDGVSDAEKIAAGADPNVALSPERQTAARRSIRYTYDDDDRLTGTWFGLGGGAATTVLSPAGNQTATLEKRETDDNH